MQVIAIFGPTAVGKTGVAIALGEAFRERGEEPVALSCDAIQVYDGLQTLSGAATGEEQRRLEHRLLAFVPVSEEFSAGRFAELAHGEIDQLLGQGKRPVVVGGTGLYLRAALSELELQPPVPTAVRKEVERDLAERSPAALHAELEPAVAATVHPRDRKRIARWTELQRAGIDPPVGGDELWTASLRHPTVLVGLTMDRDRLAERIDARVDRMWDEGAAEEARRADAAGASRTARAALGFDAFLSGDIDGVKTAHRQYARRQLSWMRKMNGVELVDRTGLSDTEVASKIVSRVE